MIPDVVVVGGGVIGLTLAYELAGQGASVEVIEQGQFGQEASWAGAGMLPPGNFVTAQTPEAKLRGLSNQRWAQLAAELREETGIDNGYRVCGGLHVAFDESSLSATVQDWIAEQVPVESLAASAAQKLETALGPEIAQALRLPTMAQVRNPRHIKALLNACLKRGVTLTAGTPVVGWDREGSRAIAARSALGSHRAGKFVVTAGAWTRQLLQAVGCSTNIEPVRGQIVLLYARQPRFRHIIEHGPRYLVPRDDGRILIGSTEERVGYLKQNTSSGVRELLSFAERLVPSLADVSIERCWSGLRPCTKDGLPILDRVPGFENLLVAAGHFRAGLQLSPGTAIVMRQWLLDQPLELSLSPFGLDRFTDNIS